MELDVLIMPNLAKMEFSVHPDYWKDELIRVKQFFISNEIYTTGPIIFTREVTGIAEVSFVTYICYKAYFSYSSNFSSKYNWTSSIYFI